jgi:CIC family chloride channel protein
VREVLAPERPFVSFYPGTRGDEIVSSIAHSNWQDVFPVVSEDGTLVGVVSSDVLRVLIADPPLPAMTIADDVMMPPLFLGVNDSLHTALESLLKHGMREVLVTDPDGKIGGFVDKADIDRVYDSAVERQG